MSRLSANVLQRLARTRLATRYLEASTGIGERTSRQLGHGMEFEDHRPYAPGDDLRFVDPNVYRRTGKPFVKQFAAYRQLPITLVVDGSRSMEYGSPSKLEAAKTISEGIAYIALAGGDRLRVCTFGRRVRLFPWSEGPRRFGMVREWIETARGDGSLGTPDALNTLLANATAKNLVILISDLQSEGVEESIGALGQRGSEVVGIHVLASEELEPGLAFAGAVRFMDIETGDEVDSSIDAASLGRYREELDAWSERLRSALQRTGGRYLRAVANDDVEDLLDRRWRTSGLVR